MTEMQVDMVNTIQSCGKTLLDTINHVLDFSKVNKKVKEKGRLRKKSGKPTKGASQVRRISMAPTTDEVEDLSILTEEVIDSVYAGHGIDKRPSHSRTTSGTNNLSLAPVKPPVAVIIDLGWRPNWNFEIDTGALRRILMNIFSNSMKYTETGFVRVSLKAEDSSCSRDGVPRSTLSLTVNDSGKGISQEFLNNHLYTPFAQEDGLAVGTGLGLSIVRQIVRDLGGSIHISSEQDSGTEARVTLPLTASSLPPTVEGVGADTVSEVRGKTTGLKACLVAFDAYPDIVDTPTGILSAEAEAMIILKSSIGSMMAAWFGMDIVTGSALESSPIDLHVILESGITGDQSLQDKIQACRNTSLATSTVLVLCITFPQNLTSHDEEGLRVFYVPPP